MSSSSDSWLCSTEDHGTPHSADSRSAVLPHAEQLTLQRWRKNGLHCRTHTHIIFHTQHLSHATLSYTYNYIHTYIHTYIHPCMHACIHTYVRTYIHTYIITYIHTYIHACMHACMHASIHPCMHACMHAYIHTYTHTYLPFYLLDLSPPPLSFLPSLSPLKPLKLIIGRSGLVGLSGP